MENYRRLQKLGSGNFAKVHLAVHVPTKTQVSLRMYKGEVLGFYNIWPDKFSGS